MITARAEKVRQYIQMSSSRPVSSSAYGICVAADADVSAAGSIYVTADGIDTRHMFLDV